MGPENPGRLVQNAVAVEAPPTNTGPPRRTGQLARGGTGERKPEETVPHTQHGKPADGDPAATANDRRPGCGVSDITLMPRD